MEKKKISVKKIIIAVVVVAFVVSIIYNAFLIKEVVYREQYLSYIKELETIKDEQGLGALLDVNPNIVAWVTVDDQNISMPVIKTSNEEEESFYLDHDIKNNNNKVGCPYQKHDTNIHTTDNATFVGHSSFTDVGLLGRHYVQSIFAGLNNYLQESSEYNYQVKVETLTNTYNYIIFAVISFNVNGDYAKQSEIYTATNFQTESEFNSYYMNVKYYSKINSNQTASFGDKFLTLFTCNENLDYRTMVIAKRV